MRKLLSSLLLLVSLALIGFGVYSYVRDRQTARDAITIRLETATPIVDVRRISVDELHQELQGPNPPLVWELRGAQSYAEQHVPGSRLVQIDQIEMVAEGLDRAQPIVTLCA